MHLNSPDFSLSPVVSLTTQVFHAVESGMVEPNDRGRLQVHLRRE